ncbi:MAG: hypothetical protein AAF192_16530, partial [Pseudomonadota bacterium]
PGAGPRADRDALRPEPAPAAARATAERPEPRAAARPAARPAPQPAPRPAARDDRGPGPRRRDPTSIDARALSAELREAEAEPAPRRRRGGRVFGFLLAVLISAAAAGAYLERARIADLAPEAIPYLDAYAEGVDEARRGVETGVAELRRLAGPLIRQARDALGV